MRLRYVRENGLPGFYFPDFLVRTDMGIWLAETKAQDQLIQADVIRKKIAAVAWCERVNELPPELRGGREWNSGTIVCLEKICFTNSATKARRWKKFCNSPAFASSRRTAKPYSSKTPFGAIKLGRATAIHGTGQAQQIRKEKGNLMAPDMRCTF